MNKKIFICIIIIILVLIGITVCLNLSKNNNDSRSNSNNINKVLSTQVKQDENSVVEENIVDNLEKENVNMIKLKIDNNVLEVELEENETTRRLIEKLENGSIIINASDYGGFEKIGSLGFKLPQNDKNISTSAGDIVLYQGDKISLFYNSNSWSYTKIGKIKNITSKELKKILGDGDIILTFSLD
jgi:hypothetical protein